MTLEIGSMKWWRNGMLEILYSRYEKAKGTNEQMTIDDRDRFVDLIIDFCKEEEK